MAVVGDDGSVQVFEHGADGHAAHTAPNAKISFVTGMHDDSIRSCVLSNNRILLATVIISCVHALIHTCNKGISRVKACLYCP